ncbi:uncharacterized protein V1518DRAFT_408216 [Limtongia smithiae]|uniref:uncharacterized protein n=1 Tax=Limtongia smithiae TaxID=1125753 RepID=UPI0034CF9119
MSLPVTTSGSIPPHIDYGAIPFSIRRYLMNVPLFDEDVEFDSDDEDPEPLLRWDTFDDADLDQMLYYERVFTQLNKRIDSSFVMPVQVPEEASKSLIVRAIEAHKQGKLNTDLNKPKWANIRRYFTSAEALRRRSSFLLNLPTELLNIIINFYATNRQLGNGWRQTYRAINGVCIDLNRVAQAKRFQKLTLKRAEDCMQFVHLLRSSHSLRYYVRILDIKLSFVSRATMNNYRAALKEILRLCPNVCDLSVQFERDGIPSVNWVHRDTPDQPSIFKKVRKLTVSSTDSSSSAPVFSFVYGFTNITRLTLTRFNLDLVQHSPRRSFEMPSVTLLSLEDLSLGRKNMPILASMLPNVEILDARRIQYNIMEFISVLLSMPNHKLRAISLSNCTRICRMQHIPRKFWTELEQIELFRTMPLHPDSLPTAIRTGITDITELPKLRCLHIEFIPQRISLLQYDELFDALKILCNIFARPENAGPLDELEIEKAPEIIIDSPIAAFAASAAQAQAATHQIMWTTVGDKVVTLIDRDKPQDEAAAEYIKLFRHALVYV